MGTPSPYSRVCALFHAAADLLLGSRCPGCAEPRLGLCPSCHRALTDHPVGLTAPDPPPTGFPRTAAAAPYDLLLQRLIAGYKEHQALWLRPALGAALARSVELVVGSGPTAGPIVLVPMPSDPRAVRRRGLDVTGSLARTAASSVDRPVRVVAALRQRRRPRDQAGLTSAERWTNLHGALAAAGVHRLGGCSVVIVDDVVTTGASLAEAARALTASRVQVLGAAVVAATQRRHAEGQLRAAEGRRGYRAGAPPPRGREAISSTYCAERLHRERGPRRRGEP